MQKCSRKGKREWRADLTGRRFGRLVVLSQDLSSRYAMKPQRYWVCLCDCGNQRTIEGGSLKAGHSQSCGCLRKEVVSQRMAGVQNGLIHGHAPTRTKPQSPTYCSWRAMWVRCTNPNDRYYHLYGGRGIKVCDRWKDFLNFLADLGERPEGCTLDRVNNDLGYEPSNCRWANPTQQTQNRRVCKSKAGASQ